MFTAGLHPRLATCRYGLPLVRETGYRLAVLTTFTRGRRYLGNVFSDVAHNAVSRLVTGLAEETQDTGRAIVGVSPGLELAADPAVSRHSGQTIAVGDLARIYGFTDVDGRQPTPYVIEPR